MRITRTFISVFLLTFAAGCISVFFSVLPKIETHKIQVAELTLNADAVYLAPPKIEEKDNTEIVEKIENWASREECRHRIKLTETGENFHGDEIEARNGETWLGLFKENNGYALRPAKVNVRRVRDELFDGEHKNAPKTGKSVGVRGKHEPIFLLKNADKLKAGKILTLFQGSTWKEALKYEDVEFPYQLLTVLRTNFAQKYEIGSVKFELKVIAAKYENGEKVSALTLSYGKQRQILHTSPDSEVGKLFWVGDLDRDGKPDFFLDLYVHDNISNTVLFLSSEAEKGKLVKKVAHFWTSGC